MNIDNVTGRSTGTTLGLDIGGTKILGVVLDAQGTVVREHRVPSPVHDLPLLVKACRSLIEELDPDATRPVGVGAAGLVDMQGELSYAPNLPGVRNAPLQADIAAVTGRRVVADNDANVAALGEVAYGAAIGARFALMVTLGTGIGGGLVIDGRVLRGAHGFAGEIGHVTVERDGPLCACGERGHWEAIASGSALGRMARELIATGSGAGILAAAGGVADDVVGESVATAAAAGDADAIALLHRYADNVAIGLANLANVLDPECIVIAGGLVQLGALLFGPLAEAFHNRLEGTEYRPPVPVLPATLGTRAGAIGAAVLARDLLS
ncbi:MAG TPA: ROK family protein [Acidimicrobiia bacterium]|nr:ROK family protein [Acidimicrobiia bacterium]